MELFRAKGSSKKAEFIHHGGIMELFRAISDGGGRAPWNNQPEPPGKAYSICCRKCRS